jgi:hypothetical protein
MNYKKLMLDDLLNHFRAFFLYYTLDELTVKNVLINEREEEYERKEDYKSNGWFCFDTEDKLYYNLV